METQKKLISFPIEMIKSVEEFAKRNYINTFTGAVIELVRRGLENTEGK